MVCSVAVKAVYETLTIVVCMIASLRQNISRQQPHHFRIFLLYGRQKLLHPPKRNPDRHIAQAILNKRATHIITHLLSLITFYSPLWRRLSNISIPPISNACCSTYRIWGAVARGSNVPSHLQWFPRLMVIFLKHICQQHMSLWGGTRLYVNICAL